MRYVYLVSHLQYSAIKNEYIKYEDEIFSSYKKAIAYIDNVILVNNGTDIVRDDFDGVFLDAYEQWDYNHLNTDNKLISLRLALTKKKLK